MPYNSFVSEAFGKLEERETQLALGLFKPHAKVRTAPISRWIKEVLKLSGIDTSVFKAHSTRAASVSRAATLGVSVSYILKRAHWS